MARHRARHRHEYIRNQRSFHTSSLAPNFPPHTTVWHGRPHSAFAPFFPPTRPPSPKRDAAHNEWAISLPRVYTMTLGKMSQSLYDVYSLATRATQLGEAQTYPFGLYVARRVRKTQRKFPSVIPSHLPTQTSSLTNNRTPPYPATYCAPSCTLRRSRTTPGARRARSSTAS